MRHLLATLLLTLGVGCATTQGQPAPAAVFVEARGDLWSYADTESAVIVGYGAVSVEFRASGLTVAPDFPTSDQDLTGWFMHKDHGETTIDLTTGSPWPYWLKGKLRQADITNLEAMLGFPITFATGPEGPDAGLAG